MDSTSATSSYNTQYTPHNPQNPRTATLRWRDCLGLPETGLGLASVLWWSEGPVHSEAPSDGPLPPHDPLWTYDRPLPRKSTYMTYCKPNPNGFV